MSKRALIIAIFCLSFASYGQSVIDHYKRADYPAYFGRRRVMLETALNFLSAVYGVNFIYEYELVKDRESPVLRDVSGNFYSDLNAVLAHHPIQYIKSGKKTIVLIAREKDSIIRRVIRGWVRDCSGKPISDAEVVIPGTSWGAVADADGSYIIENVPEGKYTLTARCVGYRTVRKEAEILETQSVNINFAMEIDVLNMDEIVTTASRNPLTKIESSVAITTANSAQIRERKPRSTADLLSVIPGFYVESSGGVGGNNLFPRGIPQDGSYRYVAMFEDGLPIFEAPELSFANIDILMRLDESISLMEGVRGGTGSIYASNAPGGVINFINKTGEDHARGIMKFSVGDYGFYRFDYNLSGPLGKNWRYSASGFARQGKGIRSPEFSANRGGQLKLNVTRLFDKGYVRIYTKYLNDRNIFYLPIPLQNPGDPHSIAGLDANYGTLTSIHQDNVRMPTPNGNALERSIRDGIHPQTFTLTGELSLNLGKGWSINNKARWMTGDVRFNAIFSLDSPFPAAVFADSVKNLSALPGFNRWEYRYSDSGAPVSDPADLNGNGLVARSGWWTVSKPLKNFINQLQLQKDFDRHKVNLSGYVSNYSAGDFWYWHNVLTEVKDSPRMLDLVALDENNDVIAAVTDKGFEQYGTFYVNAKSEATVLALALVDEWQATSALRVDGGVRLEHSRFQGVVENTRRDFSIPGNPSWAAQNVTFGDGTFRSYRHDFDEWAVSFGANYSFNPQLALYGRASRGFRTPDFEQWTISAKRGNSQYVQQLEGGVKLAAEKISLFGTLFFSRLDNIPFFDEIFSNGRIIKESRLANSTTTGAEVEAVWSISPAFHLNVVGTFQTPRLRDFHVSTVNSETGEEMVVDLSNKRVRRIPNVLLDIRPSYQLNQLKLFANWQYIGRRFVDDANTAELPAYATINAGMVYDVSSTGVSISGSVANVTNTIGLTEGNPRVEQVFANRRDAVFMARPILGRSILLSAAYIF